MITFDKPVKFGLIGGLFLVTYTVLLYAIDVSVFNPVFAIINGVVNFAIPIILAVMAINKMREGDFGGKITYLQALIAGAITLLIAFYISSAFSYVLNGVIDPEYMPRKLDEMLLSLEGKVPEETLDEIIKGVESSLDQTKTLVKSIWLSPLIAIGISAIVSLFIKKNNTIDQVG